MKKIGFIILLSASSSLSVLAAEFQVTVRSALNKDGVAQVYLKPVQRKTWVTYAQVIPLTDEAEEDLKNLHEDQKVTLVGSRYDNKGIANLLSVFYVRKVIK